MKFLAFYAGQAAFGVLLNRIKASLTASGGYRTFCYYPSVSEIWQSPAWRFKK